LIPSGVGKKEGKNVNNWKLTIIFLLNIEKAVLYPKIIDSQKKKIPE